MRTAERLDDLNVIVRPFVWTFVLFFATGFWGYMALYGA